MDSEVDIEFTPLEILNEKKLPGLKSYILAVLLEDFQIHHTQTFVEHA